LVVIPQLLLLVCGIAQFAGVGLRQRTLHLMILLSSVQRPLHTLTQLRRIDKFQQVRASVDMIILPQGLEHSVAPLGRTQLADQHALRRRLACQRHKDPLQLIPLLDYQGRVELAHRLALKYPSCSTKKAWPAPSVKVCMSAVSVGGQGEVVGALLVGEAWAVIEDGNLSGIKQVQPFGALGSGRGCWAHGSSQQSHVRSLEQWWPLSAGCAEKRPFVWYAMHWEWFFSNDFIRVSRHTRFLRA